jgi:hypothetical protein
LARINPQPDAAPSTGGGAYQIPERRSAPRTQALPEHDQFWYVFYPGSFVVMGDALVPELSTESVTGGQNGATAKKDPTTGEIRWDTAGLRFNVAENGGIILPLDIAGPGTSYLKQLGPKCIVDQHATVHRGQVHTNVGAYVAWLQGLQEAGKLPRPLPHEAGKLPRPLPHEVEGLIGQLDKLAEAMGKDGYNKRSVAELQRQIKVCEAELKAARKRAA